MFLNFDSYWWRLCLYLLFCLFACSPFSLCVPCSQGQSHLIPLCPITSGIKHSDLVRFHMLIQLCDQQKQNITSICFRVYPIDWRRRSLNVGFILQKWLSCLWLHEYPVTNTAEQVQSRWQRVNLSDMSSGWVLSGKLCEEYRRQGGGTFWAVVLPLLLPLYKAAGLLKSVQTDRMRSSCCPSARSQTLKVRLGFTPFNSSNWSRHDVSDDLTVIKPPVSVEHFVALFCVLSVNALFYGSCRFL